MTWTDHKCGRVMRRDDYQHCANCHRTFTGTEAGDLHRDGPYDDRVCLDPASVERRDADGNALGPALEYDARRDVWRLFRTPERQAALDKLADKGNR